MKGKMKPFLISPTVVFRALVYLSVTASNDDPTNTKDINLISLSRERDATTVITAEKVC